MAKKSRHISVQKIREGLATSVTARIRLLSILHIIFALALLVVVYILVSLSFDQESALLSAFVLCSINVLSGSVLYVLHRTRYATVAVYIDLFILQCSISYADVLTGSTSGATWLLFQIATPIIALILRQPRATIAMASGTMAILVITAFLFVTQTVAVTLLAPVGELYYNLALQIILLLVLSFSMSRLGKAEQQALSDMRLAQGQLQQQLNDLTALTGEKDQLNQQLTQQLANVEQRDAQLQAQSAHERQLQQTIQQLSAPIIPVLKGVLVAPLIGNLDATRAKLFTTDVLRAVERLHAHHIIIDVTGLAAIDSAIAQALLLTTNALRLLGTQVTLVGVRPEVAQTIVALGLDLAGLATYTDLQEAVASVQPASLAHTGD